MKISTILKDSLLAAICTACPIHALAGNVSDTKATEHDSYLFTLPYTPTRLAPYTSTIYLGGTNCFTTVKGHEIATTGKKDTITAAVMSPAGNRVAYITHNKKGSTLHYRYITTPDLRYRSIKGDRKKGFPTGVAFTPDARQILMANSLGRVVMLEPKKLKETGSFAIPFAASRMEINPAGTLMAISDGRQAALVNLDEKTVRRQWTLDSDVRQTVFSPDGAQLAILSADGAIAIYDTRSLEILKSYTDAGSAIDMDYNLDGKYLAVATSPDNIDIINLVDPKERLQVESRGNLSDLAFIPDSQQTTLLVFTGDRLISANRMRNLKPYYSRLITDQVDALMAEWLKMQPGETPEAYSLRVSAANRTAQRRLFEDEIATSLAGNPLDMATVSLGNYDTSSGLLAVNFSNMPSIGLPVPKEDIPNFGTAGDLAFSDMRYGVMPDDSFELIYARVHNNANGRDYIYDNVDRVPLSFAEDDDNIVSIEIIQQQFMEEQRLQEIRSQVMEQAKNQELISDKTHISVESKVIPDYNANGDRILNYAVNFTYEVEPDFSATEDFGPGKYHIEESGAASAMLDIVKQAFEGDLAQYIRPGKRLTVTLTGTADSSPILRGIPYDGSYGPIEEEPVYQNGELTAITVDGKIMQNEQLALVRALGVSDFLNRNINGIDKMDMRNVYNVNVSQEKGSQFRRITASFLFTDAF